MTGPAATLRDWGWAILVIVVAVALWLVYRWTRQPFPGAIVAAEVAAAKARAEARELIAATDAAHAARAIEDAHRATLEKVTAAERETVQQLRDDPEALAEELARLGVALRTRR